MIWRRCSWRRAALIFLLSSPSLASPSVNVALEASFAPSAFITELLETAAEENSTAYFPLLDRVAQGYFEGAGSDRDLYELFVRTLVDDGHITDPDTLSSFKFALSIHSAAPLIQAHHQFYQTSIAPRLKEPLDPNCSTWVDFGGRQFCDPDLLHELEHIESQNARELPFDRVLGDASRNSSVILYADLASPSFGIFHAAIGNIRKSRNIHYRVRYKPSQPFSNNGLVLGGYGVELALKRTDYIVIDDRDASGSDGESKTQSPETGSPDDQDTSRLKPLAASELSDLGLKAASFVMNSKEPLNALQTLTQDFPLLSTAISGHNISSDFLEEHRGNRKLVVPAGYTVMWINGVQIDPRQVDAFNLLGHLRRERRLVESIRTLGFTGPETINILSHSAIAEASANEDPWRYDYRDENEGGGVIIWLNDLEKDKRYSTWPTDMKALLQRTYPGQIPAIRKDIHNVIVPADLSSPKDIAKIVDTLQNFVKRGIPVRFGVAPLISTVSAKNQARVVYYLLDTYGLGAVMNYLELNLLKRKVPGPHKGEFESTITGRKLRQGRVERPFEQVLQAEDLDDQVEKAQKYLVRLGLNSESAPVLVNGVAIPRTDEWLQAMSARVSTDLRSLQQLIFADKVTHDTWFPSLFLQDSLRRRNPLVMPEDDKSLRHVDLAKLYAAHSTFLERMPRLSAKADEGSEECAHLIVLADFTTEEGSRLAREAVLFRKEHENVEVVFLPSGSARLQDGSYVQTLTSALDVLDGDDAPEFTMLARAISETVKLTNNAEKLHTVLTFLGLDISQAALVLNGRMIGPIPESQPLDVQDFETLFFYEQKERILPIATAIKDLDLSDHIKTPLDAAKLGASVALSMKSDIPEGIFETPSLGRLNLFNQWNTSYTAITSGDYETASIQIVATIDPATEIAQKWVSILKVLSELSGIHMRIFLNPKETLQELPVKRFYRSVLESQPVFEDDGDLRGLQAEFPGLPQEALLTMALDVPSSWLVAPKSCVHDLDNIKLESTKDDTEIDAVYELKHILIEGHSRDVVTSAPPRGAQLVLGTEMDSYAADTIVMANLGYFQFKANPGYYNIALKEGRSKEIFEIDSVGSKGYTPQPGDETTEVALTSFQGLTLFPRISRKPGRETEDVLEPSKSTTKDLLSKGANATNRLLSRIGLHNVRVEDYISRAATLGVDVLSKTGLLSTSKPAKHADINIFSVASGHLYERMLNIMIVSVMKHTNHTVKFWFIEQFLSPSFKTFLPTLAAEYNFDYEMVMYKWPHWLRAQKEKQRVIWGYKILFLDVLFPLDLDKVIFVDADQIVRTDMYELVEHDLKGAPYGFTPMCDSRTEMEGFRFWKQGYWKNFLRGLPYHISALYVVDLKRFRQIAAGDRLRQQYHQLSADPNSLSNLDQDLPNNMQMALPIHSLPQEWLWCETWCSDESLKDAKTIDLCNNPLTKEPKLDRARRQVPEWTVYDEEIAALARRSKAMDSQGDTHSDVDSSSEMKMPPVSTKDEL